MEYLAGKGAESCQVEVHVELQWKKPHLYDGGYGVLLSY